MDVFAYSLTSCASPRSDVRRAKLHDAWGRVLVHGEDEGTGRMAPDESWIVWSQLDAAGSDIYVVEGFR